MKKLLPCLALPLLAVACAGSGAQSSNSVKEDSVAVVSEPETPETPLKVFFDGFLANHPGLMNNNVTKQEGAVALAEEFAAFATADSLSCLWDLGARFEMMLPYPGEKEYAVKFSYADYYERVPIFTDYDVAYQVFGKMPREEALKLNDNTRYRISGRFGGFLTPKTFRLPSGGTATDLPIITGTVIDSEKPDFNLGTIIVEDIRAKAWKKIR